MIDIQLQYSAEQDRIRVLLPREKSDCAWWLTRRLSLTLLPGLVERLAKLPLPPAPSTAWAPSTGSLPLADQHNLLMEYDGPRSAPASPSAASREDEVPPVEATDDQRPDRVVTAVHFTLNAKACTIRLEAKDGEIPLSLNRQQLHGFLEALAQICRSARWAEAAALPDWLGARARD